METLVMPMNYVELQEDEMMYLDGEGFGYNWWNTRGSFAFAINAVALFIPVLGALHKMKQMGTLASQGRVYIRTNIDKAVRQANLGFASNLVNGIVGALFLVAGGDIGTWIASAADYADQWFGSAGWDGYIWA